LPSFRSDYSTEKIILSWNDKETGEIYKKYQKIHGDKNRTFVAVYSGEYYPVKILLFNNEQISKLIKFGEYIILPVVNIPIDVHFDGWIDQFEQKYDKNVKSILVEKEYSFKGIYVVYLTYYINEELIHKKKYDYNSSFVLLNNSEFPSNKKILGWKDKNNNEYYYDKKYLIQKDIDLYAILEETLEENGNSSKTLIIIIIVVSVLLLCIIAFLIYRYIKRKMNVNTIEKNPKNDDMETNNLHNINDI
jgi:hypothetical protein